MVTLKIDGRTVQAEPNATVLEACMAQGIKIPTLCNLKDINNIGACRMCLVEDAKTGKLQSGRTLHRPTGLPNKWRQPDHQKKHRCRCTVGKDCAQCMEEC